MAWNGSDKKPVEGERKATKQKKGAYPSASPCRGIAAGLIAVALGCGAIWWIVGNRGDTRPADEVAARPAKKAEVRPPAETNAVAEIVKPKPVDPNARPTKVGEIVNGYVMLPSGRIHKPTGVITNNTTRARQKSKYEIFDRKCNNEIACYLTMRPGDTLVGTPRYNGRFKEDFIKSINEPIFVSPSDTPEQAQLKRDVIEARLQLKDALDRGEDIEQIMLDARKELQDAMRVKQEFKQMFLESKKACETDKDVETLLEACNKMLEEKGIAPLTYGPITKRNLLRAQQREHNQQQEEKK